MTPSISPTSLYLEPSTTPQPVSLDKWRLRSPSPSPTPPFVLLRRPQCPKRFVDVTQKCFRLAYRIAVQPRLSLTQSIALSPVMKHAPTPPYRFRLHCPAFRGRVAVYPWFQFRLAHVALFPALLSVSEFPSVDCQSSIVVYIFLFLLIILGPISTLDHLHDESNFVYKINIQ